MELRSPSASSADDLYRVAETDEPSTFLPPVPAPLDSLGGVPAQAAAPTEVTAQTIETSPVVVVVGAVESSSSGAAPLGEAIGLPSLGEGVRAEKAQVSEAATSAPLVPAASPADATPASQVGSSSSPNRSQATPGARLRPKRRRRVRVRYILQAWGVSLVVHVAILSALAAATFSSRDAIKRAINFDSALASLHGGEPELVPIYADADNSTRDRAIGDEHADTAGEPPPAAMVGGGNEGEGDDGGGVIMPGGIASRLSATPRIRGAGKGRINEGSSLPGVKIDGLGSSPLTQLPTAPATDLIGGGKIAGDPLFEASEIGVALDQLAREILRHLKDHKLTVVWLFDESTSMQDDQKTIVAKFDRVSSELKLNVDANKKATGALNHAIIGFGQATDYVLEKPREDIDLIGRAIKKLRIDSTGVENTMKAIRDVVDRYANLIRKDRKLLIVLVTDESGDDGDGVEEAKQALKKYKVPLYVIGRQSLFGYPFAHHRYMDPVTKDVYYPVIRRGPESADLENYQWDGLYGRWDEQPSGFAPYELARLTRESGGIYFLLPSEEFMRVRKREQAYSSTQLKEYLPEYDNRMSYVERRNASPLRQTIYAIIMQGKDFLYRREFPIDVGELVKAAHEEGDKATLKLNALLEVQKRLEALEKVRDREPEKRWQAHYELMLAQTVAFQVKAFEYRALMASIISAPPQPKGPPAADMMITWVVDHTKKPLAPRNLTAKKYAEAERLLRAVIAKHPKTPWADLAQDTLDRGLSVQLNEWHHNPKYHERWQFVPKY
jgi:hypothetical protein